MSSPNPTHPTDPLSHQHLVDSIFSYDGNVMLAAVVSLLLVVVFVLLLHVYAKWFLAHASTNHHRHTTRPDPTRNHAFPTFVFDFSDANATKGLDPSVISAIPLFVYDIKRKQQHGPGLDCVICLTAFEDGDVGRNLPKCHHAFHLECIDMWLRSHSTCPICRAQAASSDPSVSSETAVSSDGSPGLSAVGDGGSALETVIDVSNSGDVLQNVVIGSGCVSPTTSSSSSSSASSSFGCSLKRMLSRNKSENKVFPASSVDLNET